MKIQGVACVAIVVFGLTCWTTLSSAQYYYDDPNAAYANQSYSQTVNSPAQGSYSIQYHGPAGQTQYQQNGGYAAQPGYQQSGAYAAQPPYQQNSGYAPQGTTQTYAYSDGNAYPAPQGYAAPAVAGTKPTNKRTAARVAKSRNAQPYVQQAGAAPAQRPMQVSRPRPVARSYVTMPSYGYPYQQGAYCPPGRA